MGKARGTPRGARCRLRIRRVDAGRRHPGRTPARFDLVISQFGLMFFDDPVAAFTNIRRALRAGGRATFVSWQGLAANEWLTLIADAVGQHVELPELGGLARGPGMFALAQPDDITTLLGAAGFE